ncbi:MAG: GAF domain-containing protein [Chloroflexi bacterium]|nr:GAF domain-containing protein [Chloroflexota bacterium]
MPDERQTMIHSPASTQPHPDETRVTLLPHRAAAIDWVLRLSLLLGVLSLAAYAVLMTQTYVWQMWIDVIGIVTAMSSAVVGRRYLQRGKLDPAGYWTLIAIFCAFGVGELGWKDASPLESLIAPMVILLAAYLIRPRRWWVWLMAAAGFVAFVALLTWWQPFPRVPIDSVPGLSYVFIIPGVVLILGLFTRAIRAFRIGTIRTRLLIAFAATVVLPVAAAGGISGLISSNASQQRLYDQLGALVTLKLAQVDNWLSDLQVDLRFEIARDADTRHLPTLLSQSPDSIDYRISAQGLRSRLQDTLAVRQTFEELILVDLTGRIILSTEPAHEDRSVNAEDFFIMGLQRTYISPPGEVPALDQAGVMAASPIVDVQGATIGLIAGRASIARLNQILAVRAGLGTTGETLLVGTQLQLLNEPSLGKLTETVDTVSARFATSSNPSGQNIYIGYRGQTVAGAYRWVPELQAGLLVEQDLAETNRSTGLTLTVTGIVTLIIMALSIVVALAITRSIANPIGRLAETARQIAGGDFSAMAVAERNDELGTLATAFNGMTNQLRDLIGSLEDRVASRTEELRASADVGRAAASILDTDQLLSQIVNLIVDRFGLYYAAVFTLDETGQYAVLREATGDAGRALKEKHHRLEVGGNSMVGSAVAERKAHIALDVGTEAVRFANPLLPDTRSEIALPLMVGDRVLGALDAQSTRAAAFDGASAAVLQSMADQIAVALSNAEQFRQTSVALQRAENLAESIRALIEASNAQEVGQYLARYATDLVAAHRTAVYIVDHDLKQITARAAVGDVADHDETTYELLNSGISGLVFQSGQPVLSLSADDGIEPAETRERRQRNGTGALIVVPLVAQGRVFGTVTVSNRIGQRLFTQRDVDLLMTLAAQSVSIIEKLRLFEQAQRAFSDLDTINRRLTGEAWGDFTLSRTNTSARWIGTTDRAQQTALPEVSEALAAGQIATRPQNGRGQLGIAVPIKVRDVPIGALRLVVPQTAWNDELRTTLDSIAGHVAQAAENARLIDQTQRAARREKAIAGAADRIHRSTELETVLHTAINEINRITGLSGVSVQLGFGQHTVTAGHDYPAGKAGGE